MTSLENLINAIPSADETREVINAPDMKRLKKDLEVCRAKIASATKDRERNTEIFEPALISIDAKKILEDKGYKVTYILQSGISSTMISWA